MAVLIFSRAISRDEETGKLQSYWPERVSIEQLAKEYNDTPPASFSASYMLDAQAAAGRQLQRDWLSFYLPDELEAYRKQMNVLTTGSRHMGADLGAGGEAHYADFMGVVGLERIGNRGFLTHFYMKRHDLSTQAQELESQLDQFQPHATIIEDVATHGYVYRDMTDGINEGKGSTHAFTIEKPQSKAAGGDKVTRFKNMAPRFARGQIKLPGRPGPANTVLPATWIQPLVNQWVSFPGGHDDGLDALYWAQYSAFGTEKPISVSKTETGEITSNSAVNGRVEHKAPVGTCADRNHEGRGKPTDICMDCLFNADLRGVVSGIDKKNPGAYSKAREVAATRPRYGMGTHRRSL